MEELQSIIEMVSDKLAAVANSDIVIGQPLKFGSITIVPISKISIGIGAGGGEGNNPADKRNKRKPDKGTGGGTGGGVMVRPVAVAVFSEQGVEILPIPDKKGRFDKLLDKVPEVIEMVKKAKDEVAAP
jgi:uncharacterized spore protein YtfJ